MEILCDSDSKHQNQMDESMLFNTAPVTGLRMFVEHLLKNTVRVKPH